MLLEKKVAVITGGTRGIGNAIAGKFAENGADLALIATRAGSDALAEIDELSRTGSKVRLYTCDIKDPEQVEAVYEEILADFGRVDILVNNAGITKDNLLLGLTNMDIDDVIDINLKGTIFVTRTFIKSFIRQRKGSIINISSVVGLMGNKGQANYSASKAGIIGFTKSVAKEYGKRNVRCNAIAPGYIKTRMTDALSDAQKDEIKKSIAIERLGTPDDVANLAVFLAGDNSSYITGEVIKVDGGLYV